MIGQDAGEARADSHPPGGIALRGARRLAPALQGARDDDRPRLQVEVRPSEREGLGDPQPCPDQHLRQRPRAGAARLEVAPDIRKAQVLHLPVLGRQPQPVSAARRGGRGVRGDQAVLHRVAEHQSQWDDHVVHRLRPQAAPGERRDESPQVTGGDGTEFAIVQRRDEILVH